MTVRVKGAGNGGGDVLRLRATRQVEDGEATITLDVDARTHEPLTLHLRVERSGRMSELTIRADGRRTLAPAEVRAAIFTPALPEGVRAAPELSNAQPHTAGPPAAIEASAPPPSRRELDAAWVHALAVLHDLGMCLDQGVQATRGEDSVVVKGAAESQQARARLLERLAAAEGASLLDIRVEAPGETRESAALPPPDVGGLHRPTGPVALPRLPLQGDLERYFAEHDLPDGRAAGTEVSGRMMTFADGAITRAQSALAQALEARRLADALEQVAEPSPRRALERLLRDHWTGVRTAAVEAKRWIAPALDAILADRGLTVRRKRSSDGAADWKGSADAAVSQANVLYQETAQLLAVRADSRALGDKESDEALMRLARALEALERTAEAR